MIDRKNPSGGVALYCDTCEKKFETPNKAFTPMIDHALSKGWTVVPTGNAYRHTCPECVTASTLGGKGRGLGK